MEGLPKSLPKSGARVNFAPKSALQGRISTELGAAAADFRGEACFESPER